VRELHVVGFTSDHAGLILAGRPGAKTGSYTLTLDGRLMEQIETAKRVQRGDAGRGPGEPEPGRSGSRGGSRLSPREIQARLRSGRTVAEVAAEAGVGTDWVERFATPIFAEQRAAIERAGRLPVQTARRGESDRPLAVALNRNLAARGIRMTPAELAEAWSACHLVDRDWLVSLTFVSRGRSVDAEWILDTAGGTLSPRNRLGAELGYVSPDCPGPGSGEPADTPPPEAAAAPRPSRSRRRATNGAARRAPEQAAPASESGERKATLKRPRPPASGTGWEEPTQLSSDDDSGQLSFGGK
jgi:hypothetical protein